MSIDLEQVKSWANQAPESVRRVFTNIAGANMLRDLQNQSFQMIGRYDGAMSDAAQQSFRDQYDVLTILRDAFKREVPERDDMLSMLERQLAAAKAENERLRAVAERLVEACYAMRKWSVTNPPVTVEELAIVHQIIAALAEWRAATEGVPDR